MALVFREAGTQPLVGCGGTTGNAGEEGDESRFVGQDVFRPAPWMVPGHRSDTMKRWMPQSLLFIGLAATLLLTATAADNREPPPRLRARPPAPPWNRLVTDVFFADAFTTLEGARPDFTATRTVTPPPGGRSSAPAQATSGFAWSELVSGETLIDEIKDRSNELTAALATPAVFKGGGYRECRTSLTAIATMFGVIAEYDSDVRWKQEAAGARDLFARAGFNCKAGSDQTYNEARARADDIASMVQGSRLDREPDGDGDRVWSDVAARSPLMARLEMAEKTLSAASSSAADFRSEAEVILHEAEVIGVITYVLQQAELDDYDDETYRGYASAMGEAAEAVRAAVLQGQYEAGAAAIGRLKQSCDTCHGDYR